MYKNRDKYVAQLYAGGKAHYLGKFDTPLEAAQTYDRVAIQVGRPTSKLNFPDQAQQELVGGARYKGVVQVSWVACCVLRVVSLLCLRFFVSSFLRFFVSLSLFLFFSFSLFLFFSFGGDCVVCHGTDTVPKPFHLLSSSLYSSSLFFSLLLSSLSHTHTDE